MKKGASHQIWARRAIGLPKAPRFGGWHRFLICSLIFWLFAVAALPVEAQLPWGVGSAPQPSPSNSNWEPEVFSDYLLSGQTPHPAVVRIVAAEKAGASLGSGVLVDANREQAIVLTNWHVVRDSRSAVLVQFPDGFQTAGTVVRWDEAWDLAALVIWKPPATPVPLAATPPAPGDLLTIAGYGRGPYRAQTGRCTEYLSPGTGYPKEFVELAAGARQGDSGGPILNDRGELAGVLFGQNSGRTIGSCSTRLRTFLASVGSSGFTPAAAAAYSGARAMELGPAEAEQASRIRMAAATLPGPGQLVPPSPPAAPAAITALQPPPADGPYGAMQPESLHPAPGSPLPPAQSAWSPSAISLPTTDELPPSSTSPPMARRCCRPPVASR
jgi:S1-C subfamily serine protease